MKAKTLLRLAHNRPELVLCMDLPDDDLLRLAAQSPAFAAALDEDTTERLYERQVRGLANDLKISTLEAQLMLSPALKINA